MSQTSFALIGGTLIDGLGNEPIDRAVLVVEDERITAVGPEQSTAVPRNIPTFDVGGQTIMPGLIDCHVHLASEPTFDLLAGLTDSPVFAALRGAKFARAMLQAGITACRDAGAAGGVAIGLKRAIDAGVIEGPRVVPCGQLIGITGGGKWGRWFDPSFRTDVVEPHVTGPDAVRQAVREQVGRGATAVKLMVTGLLGEESGGHDEQFTFDEICAGIDEGHRQGRHVFVHAHGVGGAKNAIRAGIDSIDHGTYLDEEAVDLMVQNGTYLVPTLSYWERLETETTPNNLPATYRPSYVNKGQYQYRSHRQSFQLAVDRGVKIAMGTDAGSELVRHDDGAFELAAMVRIGMSPMQAIVASTSHAAGLLRLNDVGSLERGKFADLVVFNGDPLADIRLLQRKELVQLVVKNGAIYRDHLGTGLMSAS